MLNKAKHQYVITDIHGCARSFKNLVQYMIQLTPDDNLYLLGDYIDRGPDSKGVLDYIMELMNSGYNVFPLRGNHEQFMLNAFESPQRHQFWFENGGGQTLKSFNAETIFDVPAEYIDFLNNLPYYFTLDKFYLVHAGFNFKDPNPFQDTDAMMSIRNFYIDKEKLGNKKIIHGHTPLPLEEILVEFNEDLPAYNIDGGCVFKTIPELQYLLALELNNWELIIQPNID